jgi:hypothetical protein
MLRMLSLPVLSSLVAGVLVLIGCALNYRRVRSGLSIALLIGAVGPVLIELAIDAAGGSATRLLGGHPSAGFALAAFFTLQVATAAFRLLFAASLFLTLREGFRSRDAGTVGPA